MTRADRDRLRALLAAATQGPWRSDPRLSHHVVVGDGPATRALTRRPKQADALLIAAAVNALPELLDELDRAGIVANCTCAECGREWEQVVNRYDTVRCPTCGSEAIEEDPDVFAGPPRAEAAGG